MNYFSSWRIGGGIIGAGAHAGAQLPDTAHGLFRHGLTGQERPRQLQQPLRATTAVSTTAIDKAFILFLLIKNVVPLPTGNMNSTT
jgi:hypothetical protein